MENRQLSILMERYPALEPCRESIAEAYEILKNCYENGGKLLVCGNGGSCADAEHLVGELMKGFCKLRPLPQEFCDKLMAVNPENGKILARDLEGSLEAICLSAHTSLNTAAGNDKNQDMTYAQEVVGYGKPGDVFMGITTSGNSRNIIYALEVAKAKGLTTIALTGRTGGRIVKEADLSILAPADETYKIQEYHLPIYHALCLMLEDAFFEE